MNINLHACMGDSCYCRPGNEHRASWTEEDKARLREAMRQFMEREKQMAGSETKGG